MAQSMAAAVKGGAESRLQKYSRLRSTLVSLKAFGVHVPDVLDILVNELLQLFVPVTPLGIPDGTQ